MVALDASSGYPEPAPALLPSPPDLLGAGL